MKFTISGILLFVFNASSAQSLEKKVDSLMNYYYQTFNYTGAVLVAQKNKVILNKGYGYKNHNRKIKHDKNDVFMIASVTKQFTAEVILMLAQAGKLNLKDKVSQYLSDFSYADSVTIENLLTHTSGIYSYTDDTSLNKHPEKSLTREEVMVYFKDKPLQFKPGTKFDYSNSNYFILGCIIEHLTGKTYFEAVREMIFAPLDMNNSGFDYAGLRNKNKSVGYSIINETEDLADSFYVAPVADSSVSYASGSIFSTAGDLYKWHKALQSYSILDKKWQDKIYVPHKNNYSYGWEVREIEGKDVVKHSGYIYGFSSYILRAKDEDFCIILLKNVAHVGVGDYTILKNILKCVSDSTYQLPEPKIEVSLKNDLKQKYEGEYVLDLNFSITVFLQANYLYIQGTGQEAIRIIPTSDSSFFTKAVDAIFKFAKTEDGGYKMMLYQNERRIELRKQ